jgi:hypothetical protein
MCSNFYYFYFDIMYDRVLNQLLFLILFVIFRKELEYALYCLYFYTKLFFLVFWECMIVPIHFLKIIYLCISISINTFYWYMYPIVVFFCIATKICWLVSIVCILVYKIIFILFFYKIILYFSKQQH